MDLRRPRVARRSNVGLVKYFLQPHRLRFSQTAMFSVHCYSMKWKHEFNYWKSFKQNDIWSHVTPLNMAYFDNMIV